MQLSGAAALSTFPTRPLMSSEFAPTNTNRLTILDGGTGTELQRRGVPMNELAWSGAAVLSHANVVRAVHEDYLRAGSEVITTNTFGSTRQMLEPAGFADHVEIINRRGVQLALEARENVGVPQARVAASISAMPAGFDRNAYQRPEIELASYREAIHYVVDAGADLIALEMMEDTVHAARAMQAATEAGLPVWLGVSCKSDTAGQITGFGRPDVLLTDVLEALLPLGPDVVNVMHTDIRTIPAAIQLIRQRWTGPIGVYPESGYFTKPNWNFVDVIAPDTLVQEARRWVRSGVEFIGGCCGTGPEHIRALKAAAAQLIPTGRDLP